ncbi:MULTISPECIES: HPF/RaiA family ribosome-associated protein [unclassified Nocardia]|uniref:ribosome hibernation promotion factor n=1 Tax=unclassified Nocardia TaxID=2637762 RepID=UPI001CE44D1E|nr:MULTISPECIES: HPF/RaiA family ribosome-associated protein [unclassified Nocardia]
MGKDGTTKWIPQVSVGRHVSAAGADYAREKVSAALVHAPEAVTSARVRLTGHADPAVRRPVVAQANVHLDGRHVRVQVAAETTREAVDLLADRLKGRMARAVRGARHNGNEWPHGDISRRWLPYFPRSADRQQVVRHKSYAPAVQTCDEAAFEMSMLDYDFHLFTESGSGSDSVLYRGDDGRYRLAQVDPAPDRVTRGAVPFTVSLVHAPVLDLEGAIVRLELTGLPFAFFRDRDSNRGRVLYHRYDGNYGLITPPSTR